MKVIDCRGLLCPEPVLRVKRELDKTTGDETLEVLVDSGAAKDNVTRLARSLGWKVTITEQKGEFRLQMEK